MTPAWAPNEDVKLFNMLNVGEPCSFLENKHNEHSNVFLILLDFGGHNFKPCLVTNQKVWKFLSLSQHLKTY